MYWAPSPTVALPLLIEDVNKRSINNFAKQDNYAGQRLDWGFIKFDIVDIDMVCQFALGDIDEIWGELLG